MEALLLIAPFIVTGLTAGFKKLPPFNLMVDGYRAIAIRFGVAVLSLLSAIGVTWMSGSTEVPVTSFEIFAEAFLVFLASSGIYFFAKEK